MLGITDYFWRLLPGNPILLRVVEAGGKRRRDLFIRCGYLGLLIFIVILWLLKGGGQTTGNQSLSDLAKVSASLFQGLSYLQLALVALLSPIFTAGAITQEKDSQTYDILLATPLTNGQIVLGSLLSRVFFVIALLVSGVPIFSITQVFGGVAIRSIVLSFLIAAATTFVTGALAMAIAVFKVGTRRTIFSFYLFIVLYLVGLYLLDQLDVFHPFIDAKDISKRGTSWFTGIHPFLALRAVFNDKTYLAPNYGDLPDSLRWWPLGFYLSNPAGFYVSFMFFLSFVLVTPSVLFLRRLAQSTTTIKNWILQKLHISTGDRTRKPRGVWANPIAWREAKTKASAARASVLRYGFIALGLIGALVLVYLHFTEVPLKQYITNTSYDPDTNTLTVYNAGSASPSTLNVRNGNNGTTVQFERQAKETERQLQQVNNSSGSARVSETSSTITDNSSFDSLRGGRYEVVNLTMHTDNSGGLRDIARRTYIKSILLREVPRRLENNAARQWLLGAVILEFSVILLIVTNAAASTVTREKEDGTLDLLLSTPITSRYYIWGKLRGLVSFVLPLVAVPVLSVFFFVIADVLKMIFGGGSAQSVEWVVFPEAVLIMPGTLIIVAAFASILGMQMSLRCRTTVLAVMSSIGIVVGACFGLGFCGYSAASSSSIDVMGLVFGSFSPFTLMTVLIDPWRFATDIYRDPGNDLRNRLVTFVFGWGAVAAYAGIVWAMYKSMVKNFDMTIRKQSR
jgi:ABC-type transport system involved in multi-copper enzyme maturation permease subunit